MRYQRVIAEIDSIVLQIPAGINFLSLIKCLYKSDPYFNHAKSSLGQVT